MPEFTIDIPQAAVDKLKLLAQRYNDANGTDYTVKEWLLRHLKELAILDGLATSAETLRRQADRDAQAGYEAAVDAERERLITDLG